MDHPQLTPHPEVLETTGVGTNTEVLRLNLENLPQYLREQVANDLDLRESVREICINSYKFMVRDNPAAKIYTEMVRAGCPKCEDGTPKTMVDLQAYWDLLERDLLTVLVFYDSSALSLETTGFSDRFLNDLSQFDGAICIVGDCPHSPGYRVESLQWFALDSQLVENIVGWIRAIALDS